MPIYETHKMKDPRIPFIFHSYTCVTTRPERYFHWHENIEIISVVEGEGYISVGEEAVFAEVGDVVVVGPNALHGFTAAHEKMAYRCLIIDRSFLVANYFEANLVFANAVRDAEVFALMERFSECWSELPEDDMLRVQRLRVLVLQLLLLLRERHALPDAAPQEESRLLRAVKQAIGFIRAECTREMSLDEVASFVGFSKYYFAREFRRITGHSFVTYLNLVRCERARELLASEEMSVGEVGCACGFLSAAYFSETFRQYTGRSPREFRREIRKRNA